MKKFLIINLFLLLIFTSIFSTVNAAIITDDSLSTNINKINVSLANKIDTTNQNYLTEIVDENGNVPAYESYPTHINSRSIKALKAYDGKIFLGLGDWNDNTGPAKIIYYDTTDGKIKASGTIADEAVESFTIIDDKIYTTGCDPKVGWGSGSYYIYNKEENKWDQHLKATGWVHALHLTEFKDKIFMSGETTGNTYSHVQYTTDKGETFVNTSIYNGETDVSHFVDFRCYNLFVCNNNLYAYFRHQNGSGNHNGIYLYDETTNRFNYTAKLPSASYSKYGVSSLSSSNYRFDKNLTFNGKFLYVLGGIYTTTDFKTNTRIDTKTEDVVQDILTVGDTLYTLSYAYNSDKSFTTRIYSTKDLENFNLVYEFIADTPPFCFEYFDNSFYVGTSTNYSSIVCKDSTKNGSLYRINLNNTTRALTLDTNNKTIDISNSGISYSTSYNLTDDKTVVKTTLTFDNTMTEEQAKGEYSKIRNLNLIFAAIANAEGIDLDSSTSYYNNVLSEKANTSSEKFTTATTYAKLLFANELNINDNLFTITTSKVSETDTEYKTEVTLTINNKGDYSSLKPVTEDSNNTNTDNSKNENYSDNNSKLPQTGKFFELKNLLQIILISSVLLVIFLSITDKKLKIKK